MLDPVIFMKQACVHQLQEKYNQVLGRQATHFDGHQTFKPEYAAVLGAIAIQVLNRLSSSTALYHNAEHTILVCLVGQEILHGKHLKESNVTGNDWLNFMVSLLCHDIGYVGGACLQDDVARRRYMLRQVQSSEDQIPDTAWINLAPGATDASLSPYHVDRSLLFVQENLGQYAPLDLDVIQQNIDFTRFPVPNAPAYRVMDQYPGLARAADLIGQLSDSSYLQKTVALFYEFEEVGVNQRLGYHYPEDIKLNYPSFYRAQVHPYIQPALTYLQATPQGCQIIESLEANVAAVEREHAMSR